MHGDAVVQKVTPKMVGFFYPEDNVTKPHNLLVSGITKKSPKPNENYMAKGVRWKIKKWRGTCHRKLLQWDWFVTD